MRTRNRILFISILIILIGLLGGFSLIRHAHTPDFINLYFDSNLISLYIEPFFFILTTAEMVWLNPIRNYAIIRNQNHKILTKLIALIILNWLLLYTSLLLPFMFLNKPFFILGKINDGIFIVLIHIFIVLILSLLLIKVYESSNPYFLLFLVILIITTYHFSIEKRILLPLYSQFFDPLWRAKHHIYG
ncbi:hypothetical protein [Lactobacillus hominis]|uniref:hypothetical protein n=1 Tax=Lactobacillus hominis TaxID=1203033 RepID=UPI0024BBAAF1|nr:hypothetical protein [Lactobacillus hominis]